MKHYGFRPFYVFKWKVLQVMYLGINVRQFM